MTTLTLSAKTIRPWEKHKPSKAKCHKEIEIQSNTNIKRIGLILDFDSEGLAPASKIRLEELLHSMVMIRHRNRQLQEEVV
jgi:hypothetical protein